MPKIPVVILTNHKGIEAITPAPVINVPAVQAPEATDVELHNN